MNKVLLLVGSFFLPFLLAGQQVNIIPQPVSVEQLPGSFSIDANTTLKIKPGDEALQSLAVYLQQHIKQQYGIELSINGNSGKRIELVKKRVRSAGDEGYLLTISTGNIRIAAPTGAGIFYGMQSLLQLLPVTGAVAAVNVPAVKIKDKPRFSWRGMHLDVSRHFFPASFIKEYIDLLAYYKLNVFHWHLVDDQGWRIEIKKYPKLTETGAWRVDHTDMVWGSRPVAQPGENPSYGGFYTQNEIREIVKYATERHVTIVPEIEMPGHVASAIAAYPFLSCTQAPQLPLTGGNYTNASSNYCAGNDSVFTFLEDVLNEVLTLFPSNYIHIGGDEVDKSNWKKCVRCQARMKLLQLKNEEELQSYFIKRIEQFLISKQRKMIGWDEILEGGLAPEATVMSWRGESGGIEAAKMKHQVVMTPGEPLYFDHYQAGPAGEPRAIGGFNSLKKVYGYDPIPAELTKKQGRFIMGAQANVWTEYITTSKHVEYMVLPRMLALAEVVWTPKEHKSWDSFNERLQPHFRLFEARNFNYCKGNFTVQLQPKAENGTLFVNLSTEAYKGDVYYTLDGTTPSVTSNRFITPVKIDTSLTVKAVTVVNGNVMGTVVEQQSFVKHQAVGGNMSYANPISRYYMADGPNTLTDGIRGKNRLNRYWLGFSGKELIATLDMGTEKQVHQVTLGCIQQYGDWVFLPQWVKFEVSRDGINYTALQVVNNPIPVNEKSSTIYDFTTTFKKQGARYIRVTGKILDACPEGHPGAGKPAWLFADEIIVD
ncbi:beta-N-acetylhexosaminidase [Niastella vici]|uniref:beta-N-acetylhexosaminidase n=1 Tax=Niastella vici TaxID=1703345 RepID=A0A1V9G014_9BACT|nr:family 20 glycosylhydrolase [Niastella vici]OQP63917.1 beta-N-acetylhexosaminidase [Niastella vici]